MDEHDEDIESPEDGTAEAAILWENAQWHVTERGLSRKRGAGRIGAYEIPKEEVGRDMWIAHIADKAWADPRDFVEALYRARRYHGVGALDHTVEVRVPIKCLRDRRGRREGSWREELLREAPRDDEGPTVTVLVDPGSAAAVFEAHGHLNLPAEQSPSVQARQGEEAEGPSEGTRYVRLHSAELEQGVRACLLTARPTLEAIGRWRGYETEFAELFGMAEEAMGRLCEGGRSEWVDARGPYHLTVGETIDRDGFVNGYEMRLSVLPERIRIGLPSDLPSAHD